MTDTTPRASRTPRNYDAILKGALSLPIEDRVKLVREINAANETEVKAAIAKAEAYNKLLGGGA